MEPIQHMLLNLDFNYKIESPQINEIDSTGCGDAFMAGIIYGLEKSNGF